MSLLQNRKVRRLLVAAIAVAVFILAVKILPLPTSFRCERDFSTLYLSDDNRMLYLQSSPSGKYRLATPYAELSPLFRKLVVAKEDKWFYYHPGVNPVSIVRAIFSNSRAGIITSGASTITMQLARLSLPPFHNMYARKIAEIVVAVLLELKYTKRQILRLYCNSVPMGGNIEGIETASYLYFKKPSANLYYDEAAVLLAILNSPGKISFVSDEGGLFKKRNEILLSFAEKGIITHEEADRLSAVPLNLDRPEIPVHALHYCLALDANAHDFTVHTGIDYGLQVFLENLIATNCQKGRSFNGASVVYDVTGDRILAYVGNDGYAADHSRMLDMCRTEREPGSLLKPFVYAEAFDHLGYTPNSIIYDIPVNIGGYTPHNFNASYYGAVSVEFALRNSLNIPPILLENALGHADSLYSILKTAGFIGGSRKCANDDLSIVLGSFRLTLMELVALYSSLVKAGQYSPLALFPQSSPKVGRKLFSPESAWLIAGILKTLRRPFTGYAWNFRMKDYDVAFKTGTSYGNLDAWSIGFDARYVVGVWFGNVTPDEGEGLVGIVDAAPALFQIFDYMSYTRKGLEDWLIKPDKIVNREICALSGSLPNDYCPVRINAPYIEGVSSYERCPIHCLYYRKPGTNELSPYETAVFTEKTLVTAYPDNVNQFFASFGMGSGSGLLPAPGGAPYKLTFRELFENGVYYIEKAAASIRIPLSITPNSYTKTVNWYVNNVHIATVPVSEKVYWDFSSGTWKITAWDSNGASGTITICVRYRQ